MTPPSQSPIRSRLLKRLMQLLLLQDLVASLQLRTRLHRGLWHPEEEQTLHLSERPQEGPMEQRIASLGHVDLQCRCVWNPSPKPQGQTWITE
jgi:hypothetical protein